MRLRAHFSGRGEDAWGVRSFSATLSAGSAETRTYVRRAYSAGSAARSAGRCSCPRPVRRLAHAVEIAVSPSRGSSSTAAEWAGGDTGGKQGAASRGDEAAQAMQRRRQLLLLLERCSQRAKVGWAGADAADKLGSPYRKRCCSEVKN